MARVVGSFTRRCFWLLIKRKPSPACPCLVRVSPTLKHQLHDLLYGKWYLLDCLRPDRILPGVSTRPCLRPDLCGPTRPDAGGPAASVGFNKYAIVHFTFQNSLACIDTKSEASQINKVCLI